MNFERQMRNIKRNKKVLRNEFLTTVLESPFSNSFVKDLG